MSGVYVTEDAGEAVRIAGVMGVRLDISDVEYGEVTSQFQGWPMAFLIVKADNASARDTIIRDSRTRCHAGSPEDFAKLRAPTRHGPLPSASLRTCTRATDSLNPPPTGERAAISACGSIRSHVIVVRGSICPSCHIDGVDSHRHCTCGRRTQGVSMTMRPQTVAVEPGWRDRRKRIDMEQNWRTIAKLVLSVVLVALATTVATGCAQTLVNEGIPPTEPATATVTVHPDSAIRITDLRGLMANSTHVFTGRWNRPLAPSHSTTPLRPSTAPWLGSRSKAMFPRA